MKVIIVSEGQFAEPQFSALAVGWANLGVFGCSPFQSGVNLWIIKKYFTTSSTFLIQKDSELNWLMIWFGASYYQIENTMVGWKVLHLKGIRCSTKYNMRLSVCQFSQIDHSRCTVEPLMSKTSEQTKKISEQIFPKFYIIPI